MGHQVSQQRFDVRQRTAHYQDLRSGTSLEIEIPLIPALELSFDLAGLFSTPVQDNIDNCGISPWPGP